MTPRRDLKTALEIFQALPKTSVTGVTGVTESNIKDLSGYTVKNAGVTGVTENETLAAGYTGYTVATERCNRGNANNINEVTPVTPVTPKNDVSQETADFLAAIQTIWPEARLLTDAERAEDKQFREQIILVREDNARRNDQSKLLPNTHAPAPTHRKD